MHLIKFEYQNLKFKISRSILFHNSDQLFVFEHSNFEFVSDFVFQISIIVSFGSCIQTSGHKCVTVFMNEGT